MQMNAVATGYVVLVTRVNEQVGISAGINASFHERQGVLRNASVVVIVVDD